MNVKAESVITLAGLVEQIGQLVAKTIEGLPDDEGCNIAVSALLNNLGMVLAWSQAQEGVREGCQRFSPDTFGKDMFPILNKYL